MTPATRIPRARNLHVPLPDATYRRLRDEADRSRRPATVLAREAIDAWLAEKQRAAVHDAISEYARATAGGPDDLDLGLEAAAVEHLVATGRNVRKRGRK